MLNSAGVVCLRRRVRIEAEEDPARQDACPHRSFPAPLMLREGFHIEILQKPALSFGNGRRAIPMKRVGVIERSELAQTLLPGQGQALIRQGMLTRKIASVERRKAT